MTAVALHHRRQEVRALAFDGACYAVRAIHLSTIVVALDPFQNAQNAWRVALTATARRFT